MKISYKEIEKHPFLQWIFIHCITKKWHLKEPNDINTNKDLKLEFKVNGHELDIIEAFDEIDRQSDEMIAKAALRLLEEKFGGIQDILSDLSNQIDKTIREEFFRRTGIKISRDED